MRYGFDEIYKLFKHAITTYNMLADDSPIMVGLSGGKDSLALLYTMKKYLRVSKYKYRLAAGHISLGFPADDISRMRDFCRELDIPFFFVKTEIGSLIFEERKEKSPCSLCARMRRGAFNSLAKEQGFNKVALAHHQDDVVETLLLNLFFEGRVGSFNPLTYLDRMDITVIRPLIYVPEAQIDYFARTLPLPVTQSHCPHNCLGKRQEIKAMLKTMKELAPRGNDRAVGALEKLYGVKWDGFFDDVLYHER
ncbi:MAG: tRNA 2-thiocytidine biosynthesis TtcA family protein [Clostridiales bacterium]|nr:tRNA 2-thiocytidine biosynthesis TtcA family protein [Clostridiales bacterium]